MNILHTEMPFDAYRSAPGINASGLKTLLRSPAHYKYELENPRKDTPALRIGRLVHQAVLEPELTSLAYSAPNFNLRTKQGKHDYESWRAGLPVEAVVVSAEERQQLDAIAYAARTHPRLKHLLKTGVSEASLFWRDPAHDDVLCKSRPDFVASETKIICDLKTCQDARPDAFARDAYKFGYFLQASHYLEGARMTGVADPDRFVIIALEKTPPYALQLYSLDTDALNLGHQQRHSAMEIYAQCVKTNVWPSYPPVFEPLCAPPWALSTV